MNGLVETGATLYDQLTHIACPCIQEENGTLGDHGALVRDVSNRSSREGESKDREVSGEDRTRSARFIDDGDGYHPYRRHSLTKAATYAHF
jgi:hypothetical protein